VRSWPDIVGALRRRLAASHNRFRFRDNGNLHPEGLMDDGREIQIRVIASMKEVEASRWAALAGTSKAAATADHPYNPFVSHEFLSALEESGSATAKTGWLGQHLILEDGQGAVGGALPCYLKSHSQGEYVFDYGWADAF